MNTGNIKIVSKIKNEFHLIIPLLCISTYLLFYLVYIEKKYIGDFRTFYLAGKQILLDPKQLYTISGYWYTPCFALLFALTISQFPFIISFYIFIFINYIMAVLFILEYNKILILKELNEKTYRFMFLIIISNGWFLYLHFFFNQSKLFVAVILLFIIRREIQCRKEEREKNLKYYLINYGFLVFAVGIAPYFIFFILIYIFQDSRFRNLFKANIIKIYGVTILWFFVQNFLFILYPSLIIDFLRGFEKPTKLSGINFVFYLREWVILSNYYLTLFTFISILVLSIFTLILIFNYKLHLEEKFSYFAIIYLFIGTYSNFYHVLVLLALILLLFITYLNKQNKGIDFIKKNKILLIGLLSAALLSFMVPENIIFKYLSELQEFPYIIFVNLRYIIFLSILINTLFIISLNKRNKKTNNIEKEI